MNCNHSCKNILLISLALSNAIQAFSLNNLFNSTTLSAFFETENISMTKSNSRTKEELPMWATEFETRKQNLRSYSNTFNTPIPSSSNYNIHIPAEYEPISAVIIVNREYDSFKDLKVELAKVIADAGVEVWMIGGGSIEDKNDMYKQIPNIDIDSTWVRDYGPIIGMNTKSNAIEIIDTTYRWYFARKNDDRLPCKLSNYMDTTANCIHASLSLDGGNVLLDGDGNFFMTDRTYDWNTHLSKEEVNEAIKSYFGVHAIHSLDYAVAPEGNKFYMGESMKQPADGTGHIDMFIKILSPCVVLIAQEDDESSIMYESLENAVDYFSNLSCPSSLTGYYQIHRICGWYDNMNSIWYSYTNSLIVNDVVIVPSYETIAQSACNDARAMVVYKEAMPEKKSISINTDKSIRLGGSIHCLTRDIPKF